MVDFTAVNNKRHLDIAIAALVHITHGHPLIREAVNVTLKHWSNQCEKKIDKE